MRMRKALLLFIGLLILVSLACEQSGEILSPEEATARAQEGVFQPSDDRETATGAQFEPGDPANVIGSGFLINLLDVPGGRIAGSQSRGSTVEILESADFEGEIWYHVDSETGDGWLRATNLEPVEGETEEAGEDEEAPTLAGPIEGDTVYLVSSGFLVNLLAEPGGRVQAVQERGVAVTILQRFEAEEGVFWYLIDAPTGQGWVSEDNISLEAP
jgi:hypothetical protein